MSVLESDADFRVRIINAYTGWGALVSIALEVHGTRLDELAKYVGCSPRLTDGAEPDRRAIPRTLCGAGGCTLAPSHPGTHRGACGCANGCKAWECPNL